MQKLSLIFILIFVSFRAAAQESPHGNSLTFACTDCHTTAGWTFNKGQASFSHDSTSFILEGQHTSIDCRTCHTSLVFADARSNCIDCHNDMHNNTVGPNCAQCHTPESWIVTNITEIHQNSRFPLLGAHNTANCSDCHTGASRLEFQPLGVECYDCHSKEYMATTNPNHIQTGLSTNCIECHRIDAFAWSGAGINHDFFPLTKGHDIQNCATCHKAGITDPISPDCYSCHQANYLSTTNPNHQSLGFSTNCNDCHTTDPGWKPANFKLHDDLYFPIYSGSHRGEWNACTDCHNQPGNFNTFSCTNCHEHNQSGTDNQHRGINGYSYNSLACFGCHPLGRSEGAFNHNNTGFPLKGSHIQAGCLDCHTNGYAGTSPLCASCHTKNYNEAVNPTHVNAGISTECETCHDENAWKPSSFDHVATTGFELTGGHAGRQCAECHIGTTNNASSDCISCHQANYNAAPNHVAQNYPTECLQCHTTANWDANSFDHNLTNFPLTGAHIATECSACHTNGYAGTSTLCASCHTDKYNNAQNPSHTAAGISTECETCHNTTAWVPSEFDHVATTGFELTGGHAGRQCAECHVGTTNNASSDCISCHQANYNAAPNHVAQNYPKECLQCHTTANWDANSFDHNLTNFPLTGAHIATECSACHTNGYAGTSMLCNSCHSDNYNSTSNPSHSQLGLSTSCDQCHTTNPGWQPAAFPNHNDYYALNGAHAKIANNCYLCHAGNYTNTANTCYGCHSADYNNTKDPAHAAAQFSTDCQSCHTENAWTPSTFDHDAQYFPIYSGKHRGRWNTCAECHTNPANYAIFTCVTSSCHGNAHHQDQGSAGCYACHPRGTGDD